MSGAELRREWGRQRNFGSLRSRERLERKRTSNHLVFKPGKPQTILMRQVLPLKVIWEKQTGSEMVLSQNQHEDFEGLCDLVREVRGWGAGGKR